MFFNAPAIFSGVGVGAWARIISWLSVCTSSSYVCKMVSVRYFLKR